MLVVVELQQTLKLECLENVAFELYCGSLAEIEHIWRNKAENFIECVFLEEDFSSNAFYHCELILHLDILKMIVFELDLCIRRCAQLEYIVKPDDQIYEWAVFESEAF